MPTTITTASGAKIDPATGRITSASGSEVGTADLAYAPTKIDSRTHPTYRATLARGTIAVWAGKTPTGKRLDACLTTQEDYEAALAAHEAYDRTTPTYLVRQRIRLANAVDYAIDRAYSAKERAWCDESRVSAPRLDESEIAAAKRALREFDAAHPDIASAETARIEREYQIRTSQVSTD